MSDATNDPPIDLFVAVSDKGKLLGSAADRCAAGVCGVAKAYTMPDAAGLDGCRVRRLVDAERLSDALERAESAEAEIARLSAELASLRSLHADHLKASAEFRGEALRRATERRVEYERVCGERDELRATRTALSRPRSFLPTDVPMNHDIGHEVVAFRRVVDRPGNALEQFCEAVERKLSEAYAAGVADAGRGIVRGEQSS